MRPDRVSATKTWKVWNPRVNELSGLTKIRPDLQYQWVQRKTEYPVNSYEKSFVFTPRTLRPPRLNVLFFVTSRYCRLVGFINPTGVE